MMDRIKNFLAEGSEQDKKVRETVNRSFMKAVKHGFFQ